jgi:hypothetical protein
MQIKKSLSKMALKLDDEQKKQILDFLCNDLQEAIDSSREIISAMDDIDILYKNNLPEKTSPWHNCSNINIPRITMAVKRFVSRFMKSVLAGGNIWVARPGEEEQVRTSPIVENILDYLARVEIHIKKFMRRVAVKSSLYGIAIGHPYWDVNRKTVHEIVMYDKVEKFIKDFPDAESAELSKEEYNGHIKSLENKEKIELDVHYEEEVGSVKIDVIDRRNFVVQKGVDDYNEARITAQILFKNWYDIQADVPTGVYGEDNNGQSMDELKTAMGITDTLDETAKDEIYHNSMKCYKGLWKYDIEGKGKTEEKFIFTVIYDGSIKHLLRIERYSYIHDRCFFIPFMIEDDPEKGFGNELFDLNLLENARHNQRVDAGTLNNIRIYVARQDSNVRESELTASHGTIFYIEPDGEMKLLQNPAVNNADVILEENMLERMGDNVTLISSYASGRESALDPRAPAAKTAMLIQQQDIGIGYYIDCLDDSFADLGYQIMSLYHQFGFSDEMFKKKIRKLTGTGYEFESYTREDLRLKGMEFGLRASYAGTNDLVERVKAREEYDLWMQHPEIVKDPTRRLEALRYLMAKYGDVIPSTIIPTAEQTKEEQKKLLKESLKEMVEEKFEQLKMQMAGMQSPNQGLPPDMGGIPNMGASGNMPMPEENMPQGGNLNG